LPNVLLHFWDLLQLYIGVKSKSVQFLRAALFREYLNFSEVSRSECSPPDMVVSIQADCSDVAESYSTAVKMVTSLAKLAIFTNFIYHHNPNALWVMGVFPTLTIIFFLLRLPKQTRVSEDAGDAEIKVLSCVNEVCQKYRLVADYAMRPFMNAELTDKTEDMSAKDLPMALVLNNNKYFPSFLGCLFVGMYIATESENVVNGEISLGTYLATIGVFNDVAAAVMGLSDSFVSLTKSFEPLGGLVEKYNKRTDLHGCKEAAAYNREEQNKLQSCPLDKMPLRLENVFFKHAQSKNRPAEDLILKDAQITVDQGQLVAITGPHGSGRATLMKMFGKVFFPSSGKIIIPTHLRVVYVSKEPILMHLSIWENLCFGLPKVNGRPTMDHLPQVIKVLHNFGADGLIKELEWQISQMPDHIKGLCDEPEGHPDFEALDDGWQERLTTMDAGVIHLSRAFIMNPEVLFLQRPLSNFSGPRAESVLKDVFVPFVHDEGFCEYQNAPEDQLKRTLFYVPEDENQAGVADVVWKLELKDETTSKSTMRVMSCSSEDLVIAKQQTPGGKRRSVFY